MTEFRKDRIYPDGITPYGQARDTMTTLLPGWERWRDLDERWQELVLDVYMHLGQRDGEAVLPVAVAAARGRHHGYRGGLWEHLGETAEAARAMCRLEANRDMVDEQLVVAACLLHDVGKGWTYGAECRTLLGRHLSHVALGTWLVAEVLDVSGKFTRDERHRLLHLIDTHHGLPRSPDTLEAVIVHVADSASAATAAMRESEGAGRARRTGVQVSAHLRAARVLARARRKVRKIIETLNWAR